MCLAIPGKILEIHGNKAIVDFGGISREVRIDLVDADVGDYVIVHVGYAIQKLSEEEAEENIRLLREMI
ncbi:MAG: HypC/HybG/HupF family hydrogenase formation chaperone [Candidatus Altiarchaeales archaeon]|nr:MAG: HypC/HybG/HupF family hydrogenase formation chaperone [Candidatus Altiarchaeales archaeon]RLI93628.1 MAG: HypC/HybG/HupF family hydrogenase formation chaperone [Candidatus Altiarchaeales archaeon]HDO82094.1 HypC/HybG/HupF family hydrogenase formation chaperone [Candidatus Altiarchaeales archaeon]HEX54743.1 HypC/HybG/HupF family hydrogenase formation chaperone [Candidatus Altiarchaeales archaeon]